MSASTKKALESSGANVFSYGTARVLLAGDAEGEDYMASICTRP